MNHWLAEELTRLASAERERELNALRLQNLCDTLKVNWSLTTRFALKLSDWLIATGERIQRRYEKTIQTSPWTENSTFAR